MFVANVVSGFPVPPTAGPDATQPPGGGKYTGSNGEREGERKRERKRERNRRGKKLDGWSKGARGKEGKGKGRGQGGMCKKDKVCFFSCLRERERER